MENFFAIDVETANTDYSSICQIGIVEFNNGQIVNTWKTLINPEDEFDVINTSIHKIDKETVIGKPTFPNVYNKIRELLENKIAIHHMPFDKVAISKVIQKYKLEPIDIKWLDSAKIVRRTWTEFAKKGYGLKNIASHLQIEFEHHDALEDAMTAGKVVIEALNKSNLSIEDWIINIKKPLSISKKGTSNTENIEYIPNPDGALYGEVIVFTGSLFISKNEAKLIAADLGCDPKGSVTKATTMLVVGSQDDYKLAGHAKSSNHRKAEDLILKGQDIRILTENDFKLLIE